MKLSKYIATALPTALIAASFLLAHGAQAQTQPPIKIGMSSAQTGPLAGGGKTCLLALQMWRDDINAKGGLLGRKVELVAYDDQGNPAVAPGIFTKLIDIDKVDLLISPYGTNPTAAVLPLVMRRNLLMIGDYAFDNNAELKYDRYFQIAPLGDGADALVESFINPGKQLGAKTIALLGATTEFSQAVLNGARAIAKREGLKVVYDQSYPPTTLAFSSMLGAIKAAKPDLVFVASYPADSVAIVRAVNEMGVGNSVKLFGGAMVGLQYAATQALLGPLLNGITSYTYYVPEKTMDFPGIRDFLQRYSKLAIPEKIDPFGYYIAPYAYAIGQVLEQAVSATKSLDQKVLAEYLHSHPIDTVVGSIEFGPTGEWRKPRVLQTQFQGIVANNMEQFSKPGKQVIIYPPNLKSGELRHPFSEASK